MQKSLEQQISDGVDLAKAGKALEVYSLLKGEFESGNVAAHSHYPLGWILYYALHQSGEKAFHERKVMLKQYLQLTLKKPHKLHSMILTEAIRLYTMAWQRIGRLDNHLGMIHPLKRCTWQKWPNLTAKQTQLSCRSRLPPHRLLNSL